MWRECSTLIASIHGRLTVNIQGEVNHTGQVNHLVIPPSALPALAQMRREASQARNVTAA
jgi:hypothetical protein